MLGQEIKKQRSQALRLQLARNMHISWAEPARTAAVRENDEVLGFPR
jgi:hypothetical protein